jgi:D-threo-aldose 1-dehydrogenase
VIVGGPFNSGVLVEGAEGSPHYDYQPAPDAVLQRVAQLSSICAAWSAPLPAAALQFPLAHPQVAAVIPGLASAHQVAQAWAWFRTDLPGGLWSALRAGGLVEPDAPTPSARVAA